MHGEGRKRAVVAHLCPSDLVIDATDLEASRCTLLEHKGEGEGTPLAVGRTGRRLSMLGLDANESTQQVKHTKVARLARPGVPARGLCHDYSASPSEARRLERPALTRAASMPEVSLSLSALRVNTSSQ